RHRVGSDTRGEVGQEAAVFGVGHTELAGCGPGEIDVVVAGVEPDLVGAADVGNQPLRAAVTGIDDDSGVFAGTDQAIIWRQRKAGWAVQARGYRHDCDPLTDAVLWSRLEDVDLTRSDDVAGGVRHAWNGLVEEACLGVPHRLLEASPGVHVRRRVPEGAYDFQVLDVDPGQKSVTEVGVGDQD